MNYDLIGIDLDGTLLNPQGEISEANRRAIGLAREAGVRIVPCTGRSWREARVVLHDLPGVERGVFVTGASVAQMDTGDCIDFVDMEPHLAAELVEFMDDGRAAVLCFRESKLAGHEYLVIGEAEVDENTQWWFDFTQPVVHHKTRATLEDLHHVLRLGMVARGDRLPELTRAVKDRFGDRVLAHSFPAIHLPDPEQTLHILEVFAGGVDKWRGISWIAHDLGIPIERVAVIGDQINDLAMMQSAACGIAMGNAIEDIKRIADRQTKSNAEDGVAHAISKVIDGEW